MTTAYEPIPDQAAAAADVRLAVPPRGNEASQDADDDDVKLSAPVEYDPRNWKETFLVLRGRPFLDGLYGVKRSGISALLAVWAVGSALVVTSAIFG
jgi:hypothetical protein